MRVIAILGVLIVHAALMGGGAIPWLGLYAENIGGYNWTVFVIWRALVVFCLPLFLMISGYLFLDPRRTVTMKKLLRKNIPRIVIAFYFWSFLYAIIGAGGGGFWEQFFAGAHHMWFFFLIVGCYLITPILRKITENKTLELQYLLICGLGHFILPYFLPAVSGWLMGGMFLNYSFFFVAGHFLGVYCTKDYARKIIYVLAFLSIAAHIVLTITLSKSADAYVETYGGHIQPFSIFMPFAVFLYFQNRARRKRQTEGCRGRLIRSFAECAFGVHILHIMVYMAFAKLGFTVLSFNPIVCVPVISVACFAVSFVIIWCIRKIPFVGKWIT